MTNAFTAFDWFLLALIAMSTLAAFFRGFVKVLFSLGGLVLGIVAASWYYPVLAPQLSLLPTLAARQVAAFVLLFMGVMVVFTFVAGLIRKAISVAGLGLFDRILGGLFGFGRGLLLGVVCMMAFAAFTPEWAPLKNSQLAPYFLSGSHAVSFIVPEHFAQMVADGATHLLQQSPALFDTHTLGRTQHYQDR